MASNLLEWIKFDLAFVESLRTVGYSPLVLLWRENSWAAKYYRLWDITDFVYWDDYLDPIHEIQIPSMHADLGEILAFELNGIRVGRWVVSWVMRQLRVGSIDLGNPRHSTLMMAELKKGVAYANAATSIIKKISPNLAIFLERSYTPWGQLYDVCLHSNVDVIQWIAAHKSDALMLKRYNIANETMHPTSLSKNSWEYVKNMPWSQSKSNRVIAELDQAYQSGDWSSKIGAQFNKKIVSKDELVTALDLDPRKKTAVIFPHLFWDATFFYGRDLFLDYEDWFVQTVRAAAENSNLNWIIKLHPANVVKRNRDGFSGEYSELLAIRSHFGSLPNHIKLVSPESEISTFSFFSLMDYCLTVRGTIGIEAGVFGIPVLTAGTGRYDHLGFTLDFQSADRYLEQLADLERVTSLTRKQQELAQRFAYGILLMRPFNLHSMRLQYNRDATASAQVDLTIDTTRELVQAPDFARFADWASDRDTEDWLIDD